MDMSCQSCALFFSFSLFAFGSFHFLLILFSSSSCQFAQSFHLATESALLGFVVSVKNMFVAANIEDDRRARIRSDGQAADRRDCDFERGDRSVLRGRTTSVLAERSSKNAGQRTFASTHMSGRPCTSSSRQQGTLTTRTFFEVASEVVTGQQDSESRTNTTVETLEIEMLQMQRMHNLDQPSKRPTK